MKIVWKVSELVGSEIETENGACLGVLKDVLPTGANDVFVVRKQERDMEREILIPALKSVVLHISLAEKKIIVRLPTGLEEIYFTENRQIHHSANAHGHAKN